MTTRTLLTALAMLLAIALFQCAQATEASGAVFVVTPSDVIAAVLLAVCAAAFGLMIVPRTTVVLLVLFIGLAVGKCAQAEGLTMGLHVHSLHVPAKEGDSNQNWGLYVRSDSGLTFGMYRSTLRRNAPYIGQTFQLYGPVDLTLGAIGSYQRKDGQGWSRGYIGPLVALSVASPVSIMGATPRITLVPGHLVKARTVVHFSTEWRF